VFVVQSSRELPWYQGSAKRSSPMVKPYAPGRASESYYRTRLLISHVSLSITFPKTIASPLSTYSSHPHQDYACMQIHIAPPLLPPGHQPYCTVHQRRPSIRAVWGIYVGKESPLKGRQKVSCGTCMLHIAYKRNEK
jgi:hypothetical protein